MTERAWEYLVLAVIGIIAFLLLRFVFRDRLNQFYANRRRGRLIVGAIAGLLGVITYRLVQVLVN